MMILLQSARVKYFMNVSMLCLQFEVSLKRKDVFGNIFQVYESGSVLFEKIVYLNRKYAFFIEKAQNR